MFKVKRVPGKGHGVIANHDIPAGNVVFTEEALVIGPASPQACIECLTVDEEVRLNTSNIYNCFFYHKSFCVDDDGSSHLLILVVDLTSSTQLMHPLIYHHPDNNLLLLVLFTSHLLIRNIR